MTTKQKVARFILYSFACLGAGSLITITIINPLLLVSWALLGAFVLLTWAVSNY